MPVRGLVRLHIGIVCYPSYGGSGVVATELAMALARRDHVVHLISYEPPVRYMGGDLPIRLHTVDIPQYPLFKYPPYLLALANKLVEVARYQRLDVLHVHYAIPHATAGYLAKQMLGRQIPLVTTLHGTDITLLGADPSFYDVIEFSMNESDALTAVSKFLRTETERRFQLRRPIDTIYNFVDTTTYKPQTGPKRRAVDNTVVVHVSNFRPVKRVPLAVEIFAAAAADLQSELWLIGDGPDSAIARRRAAELGVADRLTFWGKQENPAGLIAAADVMLLPSAQESFGLAALEAMACGLPVVASKTGGLPEVVVDGECGFLVEPDDTAGFVGTLRRVLTNPAARATMGMWGRNRVLNYFAPDRIVSQYEELYEQAMLRRRGTIEQDVIN